MNSCPDTEAKGRRPFRPRVLLRALLMILLLLCVRAGAEPADWICPACGQEGNTGNYCPECGAARPVSEVNDGLTQIPGETDRVMVDILRIDGSGFIRDRKDKFLYAPEKAIDEDETTCWQVAVKKGRKDAPWLAMVTDGQAVDEIWIKNGFRKTGSKGKDQYPLYARLKEIRVVFCCGDNETREMTFTLADRNRDGWEKFDTGRLENVCDVVVDILSVYPGSSGKTNACLSEFMLVQKAPSSSAKPATE